MRPILEQNQVEVVALSPDSVAQAAAHRRRDDLTCALLCDPDRSVIRAFGVQHRRGLVHRTFRVLGVPLGIPTDVRELAIPTTLLIDEAGVVRWIDTATDYRLRGDEERINRALESAFGRP